MEVQKVSRQVSRDRRAAFHQAGHAVMLILALEKFSHLSLDQMTGAESALLPGQSIRPWHYVMVMLAGGVAEEVLSKREDKPFTADDIEQELHRSELQARAICQSPVEGRLYLQWCRARARNLLKLHWPAVKRIAAELLARRAISYETARRIFDEAPRKRRKPKFAGEWKKAIIAGLSREKESIPFLAGESDGK